MYYQFHIFRIFVLISKYKMTIGEINNKNLIKIVRKTYFELSDLDDTDDRLNRPLAVPPSSDEILRCLNCIGVKKK